MSKKKCGIKKGSTKSSSDIYAQIVTLVNAYNLMCETQEDKLVLTTVKRQKEADEYLRHFSRVYMSDMMTVALGRMGFREKRFRTLNDTLLSVVKEYNEIFADDLKVDEEMVYSRASFEREMKSYTGAFYAPESERY